MKKTSIILGLIIFNFQFSIFNSLSAQEKELPRHEVSVNFQGLGFGSMPFSGDKDWNNHAGLSLGFGMNYTYWFNDHVGFRTGLRLNSLTHSQSLDNLNIPFNATMSLSSLGLPGGSGNTNVSLLGTATAIDEQMQYTFVELPLQLALRCDNLFLHVGVSLAKAVKATASYSYEEPDCSITALPDLGITMPSPVPVTLGGEKERVAKSRDIAKPFYCLLDAEVGYTFHVHEATSLSVGLFGRLAPVSYSTDADKEVYTAHANNPPTYTVEQPSTTKLVEKMGYYEVGLNVALNLGIGAKQKKACSHDHEPVLTPNNDCCKEMASELAALKAACKKAEEDLAALKAEQRQAEVERLKAEANREKAEAARDKAEAARDKAEVARQAAEKAAKDKAAAEKQAAMAKAEADRMATEKAQRAKAEAQKKLEAIGATVYFKSSGTKAQFDEQTDDAIHAICEAMKADNTLKVTVFGHTDNKGSFKTNMKYGYKRAKALKNYMVKLGAPAKNIKCESKGPKEPVADNKTNEGRALNRRATVELK